MLVVVSFTADDVESQLTGTATVVKSRVFLKYNVTNRVGGSWTGEASFDRSVPDQLSGRLKVKNGDDVPIVLRKIVR